MGTLPEYRAPGTPDPLRFFIIDSVCVAIFSVDYVLRLATCVAIPWTDEPSGFRHIQVYSDQKMTLRDQITHAARKLFVFVISPLNIIDALSIFPSFSYVVDRDSPHVSILRVLRLGRIFRLAALGEKSTTALLYRSLWRAADTLLFMLLLFGISVVFFSSTVFFCEKVTD